MAEKIIIIIWTQRSPTIAILYLCSLSKRRWREKEVNKLIPSHISIFPDHQSHPLCCVWQKIGIYLLLTITGFNKSIPRRNCPDHRHNQIGKPHNSASMPLPLPDIQTSIRSRLISRLTGPITHRRAFSLAVHYCPRFSPLKYWICRHTARYVLCPFHSASVCLVFPFVVSQATHSIPFRVIKNDSCYFN